jgi:hypothetical protein
MGTVKRGLAMVALLVALLHSPEPATVGTSRGPDDVVLAEMGLGWGKALCVGCGATIIAAGGFTWGGLLVLSFFHPDAVVACAFICYDAFSG